MTKTYRLDDFGYEVVLGKFARQADGAVWFKHGGTVVLATAVSSQSKEFPGFLPLTVDYREYFSAAGKIPGGYYKREGRLSDKEVLTARLIDRAIRPLFPVNFFDQVQVIVTVYSVDKEHAPNTIALIAGSLALSMSKIPFLGPVGAIEVGRIDGKWVVNPLYSESKKSDVRLVFAGTEEGICMVEGSASEISENEFLDALFMAHEAIKKQVAWQEQIQREIGLPKEEITEENAQGWGSIVTKNSWNTWSERVTSFLTDEHVKKVYIEDKVERNKYLNDIRDSFVKQHEQEITEKEIPTSVISYIFDAQLSVKITELIIALKKRVDGRSFDQVRQISSEVGLLPFTHGSGLFTRGRTQGLVSVTLGSGEDEQRIESIMEDESESRFMLHYNFPPFSVGEVRFLRGPGRREIGHGYLAASSLKYMLPPKDTFPYTIRIVADMLESDGSTSMATACGSTLALMDAGVPIKKMVSGIAMGLLKGAKNSFAVLSDINGFEDMFGLMDFKVVGTEVGITAIQMDVKYKGGLSRDIFQAALDQAKKGRVHILTEMRKVIHEPRSQLSELVPRVVTLRVDTDKIGAIIGTGGKVIREIIDQTGTSIDIEPDGLVKIFGTPGAELDKAINWVKTLAGQIEPGAIYQGKIRKVAEFGLFVELVPGQDGLVHVSNIPRDKQKTFATDYRVNDIVTVQVVEYDEVTGRIRLRLLESKE